MLPADDYQVARECHRAGDWARAEAGYRRVLATRPDHAPTLHGLGALDYQHGRLDSALGWLERAVRSDPDHAEALVTLGVVLAALRRPVEAPSQYDRAL